MTDHQEMACAWITSKVDEKMVATANSLGIRKIDGQEASGHKDIATTFQSDGSEGMCRKTFHILCPGEFANIDGWSNAMVNNFC